MTRTRIPFQLPLPFPRQTELAFAKSPATLTGYTVCFDCGAPWTWAFSGPADACLDCGGSARLERPITR